MPQYVSKLWSDVADWHTTTDSLRLPRWSFTTNRKILKIQKFQCGPENVDIVFLLLEEFLLLSKIIVSKTSMAVNPLMTTGKASFFSEVLKVGFFQFVIIVHNEPLRKTENFFKRL